MNEPLRVLCVFSWLDRGGAETMCMDLYRHIDRSRVQFDFVKHASSKGAFEDEIRRKESVVRRSLGENRGVLQASSRHRAGGQGRLRPEADASAHGHR